MQITRNASLNAKIQKEALATNGNDMKNIFKIVFYIGSLCVGFFSGYSLPYFLLPTLRKILTSEVHIAFILVNFLLLVIPVVVILFRKKIQIKFSSLFLFFIGGFALGAGFNILAGVISGWSFLYR